MTHLTPHMELVLVTIANGGWLKRRRVGVPGFTGQLLLDRHGDSVGVVVQPSTLKALRRRGYMVGNGEDLTEAGLKRALEERQREKEQKRKQA